MYQFKTEGFTASFRLNRDVSSGVMLYVREGIPAKLLTTVKLSAEGIYVEFHLRKQKWLVNKPTCYKNPMNPSCIDLILTKSPKYYRNSIVFEIRLSDFHKMVVTIIKPSHHKLERKIVNCRQYKDFSNNSFREVLINEFSKVVISKTGEGFIVGFLGLSESFRQIRIQETKIY